MDYNQLGGILVLSVGVIVVSIFLKSGIMVMWNTPGIPDFKNYRIDNNKNHSNNNTLISKRFFIYQFNFSEAINHLL